MKYKLFSFIASFLLFTIALYNVIVSKNHFLFWIALVCSVIALVCFTIEAIIRRKRRSNKSLDDN
jgi:hypothetical protein